MSHVFGELVTVTLGYVNPGYADAVEAKTGMRPASIYNADMRDAALDDMRQQLAEARTDRDRYIARCAELERRLELVREVVR